MSTDPGKLDDFLATARKRFAVAAQEEKKLREKYIDDLRFASPDGDEQWDLQVKQQREAAGRPAMAFPRCHTFVQQIANQARQQKPQIKFAQSDAGSKEAQDVMEGLARHIQYASDAQIAYDTAIECSASGSFGYYRIMTDYVDDDTDDQDIQVVPIRDPLTVYGILVPAIFGRKPKWWFVIEDLPKDEFKDTYGESEMSSLPWSEAEKRGDGWFGQDTVRIAEYWWTTEERVKGRRRPVVTIHMCKTNGFEILPGDDGETSETIWPGSRCNIIPVLGPQMIVKGEPRLFSVVRPQKAAQQMLNYSKSRIAETLAQSPVSPFIVVEGQTQGYEKEWANLNTVPRPYLTVKAIDVAGRPAEKPQRQVYEPPIQALSSFVMQEVDDMKATTGIYDAAQGSQGNETSGQAIARRANQSNLTTMHFMDNLERSFKQAGEVIGELIPKIYDAPRAVKILGADESQKIVKINQEHVDENGKAHTFNLSELKGTWIVTSGKAYGSKRAESFDSISQVVQTAPNMLPIVGDILFRNSDMAGADELAERFKKMLPPNLQDDKNQQIPPQAQAAIQQLQTHMQALNAACQHYEQTIQQLQFEKQAQVVKGQNEFAIRRMEIEADLAKAEITTKAQNMNERIAFVEDMMKQIMSQSHEAALQTQQQGHQQELAQQAAQQAQEAQQQPIEQQPEQA